MNAATEAQIKAARPRVSTWLTANAGSGKTRVLTNRVARLLLNGVRPESILCLTYTKAAASEMQNRLFQTLGTWAMLPDQELVDALQSLGEQPDADLGQARVLFASAIEAPGGLKIQTIHSFCSKILRQFPLEAGVNPQFVEMDEPTQSAVIREVIEQIAIETPSVLGRVQPIYSGNSIVDLAKTVARHVESFQPARSADEIYQAYGLPLGQTLLDIVEQAVSIDDIAFLKSLAPMLLQSGGVNDGKLAKRLQSLSDTPTESVLTTLEDCLLTKDTTNPPFAFKRTIPNKGVRESPQFAPLLPQFTEIGERVEDARKSRLVLQEAQSAAALHAFASEFLPRFQKAKAESGLLDFDDLILRTRALLTSQSLSWVLYRLDSRIDHVLVDEAQDTSPAQWDIIEALTREIVSGEDDRSRTLFVVGDKKQSIYSFQGADAESFDERERHFRDQLQNGPGLAHGELLHSFRSSPAILDVVDAVFSKADGTGSETRHRAFHETMPGRVDLWPLVEPPVGEEEVPWYDPQPRTVDKDASYQLATELAEYIHSLLETGTIQGKKGQVRRIHAGDILILVQRRSLLFDKIIAACKSRGLPVAGADRLKVGSELAVRDILALLSFLALQEDDLSLAAALRSPLFSWSEAELYDLAANRKKGTFLWQELRRRKEEFAETFDVLKSLRDRVDFERPFELIHTILTQYNGRERLLQRLGPEAEDGIDELLNQALSYEANHVPSLTGFLSVAHAADIDVKRQTESDGKLIRVMTVHGAKGLESPIVILPDTTFVRPRADQSIVSGPGDIATLTQGKARSSEKMVAAKEQLREAEMAERDRLLYVAMTRAEKWLIVCGVKPKQDSGQRISWHDEVSRALETLGAEATETPIGQGLRYALGAWAEKEVTDDKPDRNSAFNVAPPSLGSVAVPAVTESRSPSKLGGSTAIVGVASAGFGGVEKGQQMHLLLEHLPAAGDALETARRLLDASGFPAEDDQLRSLLAEAQAIIARYPEIFAETALPEVGITAFLPRLGERIRGAIDRLVVSDARVLAVDFKTNAVVPQVAKDTPEEILRQLGAYLEALEAVYPDRMVDVAVLWTATGDLMTLDHGIVRQALQRATTS
jgi:ATP-dependent helicase/nuclease subunit A